MTTTELITTCINGICKNMFAIIAITTAIMPAIKKPPINEKSFLEVKTYADNAKKISAVEPNACIISAPPFGIAR